jgi:predicted ABC-type ATPase
MPQLYIIAGPNGAGKTTAAFTLLPELLGIKEFVNADEIARGISPFNVEAVAIQAGKIMLTRIDELLNNKVSFAYETTLTTISYLKTIDKALQAGYSVTLFYIWLNTPMLAIQRVRQRVGKGGHNIPADIVERRYYKAIKNLPAFCSKVSDWYIYDNSGSFYAEVAKNVNNQLIINNFDLYNKIKSYGNW